jgi:hypothetical protein
MSVHRAVDLAVPPFTIASLAYVLSVDSLFLIPDVVGKRLPRTLTGTVRRLLTGGVVLAAVLGMLALRWLCASERASLGTESKCYAAVSIAHVVVLAWLLTSRFALASTRGRWRSSLRSRAALGASLATSFVLLSDASAMCVETLAILLVHLGRRAAFEGRWCGGPQQGVQERVGLDALCGGSRALSLMRGAVGAAAGAALWAARHAGGLVELAVRARVARTALASFVSSSRAGSDKASAGALLVAMALPLPLSYER